MTSSEIAPEVVHHGLAAALAGEHHDLAAWIMKKYAPPSDFVKQTEVLFIVCAGGRVSSIEAILEYFCAGARAIDVRNAGTMFLIACRSGSRDIAEWVVAHSGIVLASEPGFCYVAAEAAITNGDGGTVEWILDQSPLPADAGKKLFQLACINGHLSIARMLANRYSFGADEVMEDDNVAMCGATQCGHFEVVDWLTDTYGIPVDERPVTNLEVPDTIALSDQSDIESMLSDLDDAPAPERGGAQAMRDAIARVATAGDEGDEGDEDDEDDDDDEGDDEGDEVTAEPDANIASLVDI